MTSWCYSCFPQKMHPFQGMKGILYCILNRIWRNPWKLSVFLFFFSPRTRSFLRESTPPPPSCSFITHMFYYTFHHRFIIVSSPPLFSLITSLCNINMINVSPSVFQKSYNVYSATCSQFSTCSFSLGCEYKDQNTEGTHLPHRLFPQSAIAILCR